MEVREPSPAPLMTLLLITAYCLGFRHPSSLAARTANRCTAMYPHVPFTAILAGRYLEIPLGTNNIDLQLQHMTCMQPYTWQQSHGMGSYELLTRRMERRPASLSANSIVECIPLFQQRREVLDSIHDPDPVKSLVRKIPPYQNRNSI